MFFQSFITGRRMAAVEARSSGQIRDALKEAMLTTAEGPNAENKRVLGEPSVQQSL